MNIWIQRNGDEDCNKAFVGFGISLGTKTQNIWFGRECGSDLEAELVCLYLETELQKAIKGAHEKGYEQGWNDKTKKKRKAVTFATRFCEDDVVGE